LDSKSGAYPNRLSDYAWNWLDSSECRKNVGSRCKSKRMTESKSVVEKLGMLYKIEKINGSWGGCNAGKKPVKTNWKRERISM